MSVGTSLISSTLRISESSGRVIGLYCGTRVPTKLQEFQINMKLSQKRRPDYFCPVNTRQGLEESYVACTQHTVAGGRATLSGSPSGCVHFLVHFSSISAIGTKCHYTFHFSVQHDGIFLDFLYQDFPCIDNKSSILLFDTETHGWLLDGAASTWTTWRRVTG
jgi:hypothetical protein